jgi:hypothetical protein
MAIDQDVIPLRRYIPSEASPDRAAALAHQPNVRSLAIYLGLDAEDVAAGIVLAAGRERMRLVRGGHSAAA